MNPEVNQYSSEQKPNSRSSSSESDSDNSKRRRLAESNEQSTPVNTMFRPNITQSVLIQQQLLNMFGGTANSSPTMSRSQSVNSNSPKSESPTPSLTNLHIEDTPKEKSRYEEQLRLREEYKRRQRESMIQARELELVKREQKRIMLKEQEELRLKALQQQQQRPQQSLQQQQQQRPQGQQSQQPQLQQQRPQKQQQQQPQPQQQPQIQRQPQRQPQQPSPQQPSPQQPSPQQPSPRQSLPQQSSPQQPQPQQQKKEERVKAETLDDDDDLVVDEEMTNKNVCMGMVKTDIVVEKSPLILIRDEQYEIVSLESEGKLNTENYSFKVTSRSQPPRFYGWIPFQDTKVLGPLVDHRLIWWDAVIPRGKATNTRTPICIILYCRPDLLGTIAKYFESQRVILKTPPFYNPACRYSNPHHHILEQQYQLQQQQYRQQQQQQQQQLQQRYGGYGDSKYQSYTGYQYNSYGYNSHIPARDPRQEQKDIEMLLASIPSDVPRLSKKKKKKALEKNKNAVIEINDDDDDAMAVDDEEEEIDDEDEDSGYVEGLTCHLMEHQIKGVSWMIDRENNESSNGGILADMGLGKTIQTIALMASTMTSEEEDSTEETKEDHRITLIVTPLALVHQWVDEIITKTEKNKLRVLKHHGPNRTKNPAIFKHYDVVVTTYQVVASDMPSTGDKKKKKKKPKRKNSMDGFIENDEGEDDEEVEEKEEFPSKYCPLKKDHGPLFQINWHRVVLDEAQFIKNRTTKASISCATLSSVKRWCLTGTPIQNNVDELYSLLRFLRIQPLSEYATFKKNISIPIMNGDTRLAMSRLKAVLMAVMLRRTKDVLGNNDKQEEEEQKEQEEKEDEEPSSPSNAAADENLSKKLALKLPSRQKTDIVLEFSYHEKALYQLLMTKTKQSIQTMVGSSSRYMNMLCMLLRLRQACDHPQLILNAIDNDKDVMDIVSDVPTNTTSDSWNGQQQEQFCELCGRSNNQQQQQDKTPYCYDCIQMIKSNQGNDVFQTSTKIRKVIEILNATRESNPGEKTIIFSQFTSMLDLMEEPLKKNGFKVCRYDGSMSSQLREKSLTTLKYDPKCTVMLISLKCGSLGLNLTSANRVILVDIWWNPAVEEQAIDRVHRIGQRLPVHVTRLLIDNTVEQKIVQLQEKKAQLSKGALGDGLVKNAKLTASEIRSLFNL